MPTTIRSATADDAELLTTLCAGVHEPHLAVRPDEFKPFAPPAVAEWFRALLNDSAGRIWIAESDARAVGFLAASVHMRAESPIVRERRWLEVDQIAVEPEMRRRGIARVLIQAAADQARREGLVSLQMTTWWFNDTARDTMKQLGFRPKVVRFEGSTDALAAQPAE